MIKKKKLKPMNNANINNELRSSKVES